MLTVALVNQDRENNIEKRSQGLKSEKEALLIGKKILFSFSVLSYVNDKYLFNIYEIRIK